MSMKNSNRTRNLPSCSAVPEPTALQRVRGSELVQELSEAVTVIDGNFPISLSEF